MHISKFGRLNINQSGHAHIFLAVAVVSVIGFIGYRTSTSTHAFVEVGLEAETVILNQVLGEGAAQEAGFAILPTTNAGDEEKQGNNDTHEYKIQLWGIDSTGQGYDNLKNIKVTLHSRNRSKHRGCGSNGLNKYRDITATTNRSGVASFHSCTIGNYDMKLSKVPAPWSTKSNNPSQTRIVHISKGSNNSLHADIVFPNLNHVDPAKVPDYLRPVDPSRPSKSVMHSTTHAARPSRDDAKQCEDILDKEEAPTGAFGATGGNKVTYQQDAHTAIIKNVLKSQLTKIPSGLSSRCKEKIKHSRTFVIHMQTIDYPNKSQGSVRSSVPVTLRFHGPGGCKSANPGRSGSDSKVEFTGCTRNQVDIEVATQSFYPAVERADHKAGYVKVTGFSSPSGATINVYVQLQNELNPYTNAQRFKFNAAARRYWHSRRNEGKNNGHPEYGITNAKCQPEDIQIRYENQRVQRTFVSTSQDSFLAEASNLFTAYQPSSSGQCFIRWNTRAENIQILDNERNACLVFVHEYGHMLGYGHATGPTASSNIMLAHPIFVTPKVIATTGC